MAVILRDLTEAVQVHARELNRLAVLVPDEVAATASTLAALHQQATRLAERDCRVVSPVPTLARGSPFAVIGALVDQRSAERTPALRLHASAPRGWKGRTACSTSNGRNVTRTKRPRFAVGRQDTNDLLDLRLISYS